MRLIDADKLKKHYSWWQGGTLAKTLDEMKRDFDTIIDLQPTVEAEPTKHGHWIWDKENDKMYCSECGYETDNWGVHQESDQIEWQLPNYCENCGAKMDEVEE